MAFKAATLLTFAVTAALFPLLLQAEENGSPIPLKSFEHKLSLLKKKASNRRSLEEDRYQENVEQTLILPSEWGIEEFCSFLQEEESYGDEECDCEPIDGGIRFICIEPNCQYCNEDFSICGTVTYGADLSETEGASIAWYEVELMGDPPVLVRLEQSDCNFDFSCNECKMIVDGEECTSCGFCNSYGSLEIDCEAVELGGDYANFNFSANECQSYDDDYYYPDHPDFEHPHYHDDGMSFHGEEERPHYGNSSNVNVIVISESSTTTSIANETSEEPPERALEDYYGDDDATEGDYEYEENEDNSDIAIPISYPPPTPGPPRPMRKPSFLETYVYGQCLPRDFEFPTNDDCSDAIEVSPGSSVLGWLYGATVEESPPCNNQYYRPIPAQVGIWYTVTGTGNVIHLSTCSEETDVEVVISVYEGGCDSIECPSDLYSQVSYDCEAGNRYPAASVSWLSTDSVIYSILVASSYGSLGTFELSVVDIVSVENDDCGNAASVDNPDGSMIVGSIVDGKASPTCSSQGTSTGVWYTVDGIEGGSIRVSTCTFLTNFPAEIAVFSGGCGSQECITDSRSEVDRERYCRYGSTVQWLSEPDTKYYIFVYEQYEQGTASIFGLTVLRFIPPENDVCTGAIEADSDYVMYEGSTSLATGELITSRCTNNNDYYYYGNERRVGVWYSVEGTGSGLRLSTCSEATDYESHISVYTGSCGSLQCITEGVRTYDCFSDYSYTRAASFASWISDANTTYYILIHGATYSQYPTGEFGLVISQFVPPPNDVCVGASPLSMGDEVYGSTEVALAETQWQDGYYYCGINTYVSSTAPGVWYSLEGTGFGVRVSTCSFETTYESAISVFTGSCSNLTCIAASTYDSRCFLYGTTSSWITEADTTYYILVHGSYSEAMGNFSLSLTEFEPAENDECSGATAITVDGDTIEGSLDDATVDRFLNSTCGIWIDSPGVWYRVDGEDTALRASTCSSLTTFDTALTVYSGECDQLQCIVGSSYDSEYCGESSNAYGASSVSWLAEAGTVYYILVHSRSSWSSGSFGLTVETFETAENDACEGAVTISPGSVTGGSTLNATIDFSPNTYCGYAGFNAPGVWYKVEGTGSGMKASTCSEDTDYNTALAVFEGDCGDLRCIDANEYAYDSRCSSRNGYGNSEVSWGTSMGSMYYILVYGGYQGSGNFGLSLSAFENAAQDVCDDAVVISSDGDVYTASTLNATIDFPNGRRCGNNYMDGPGIWFVVVGTGSALRASTCNANARSRAGLSIFSGTCSDLTCVGGAAIDYRYDCSTIGFLTSSSTNYYIYVQTNRYDEGFSRNVGVSVEEFEPAANDVCGEAEELVIGGDSVLGSIEDATQDPISQEYCYQFGQPYPIPYASEQEEIEQNYNSNNYYGHDEWGEERYGSLGTAGVWYTVVGTGSGLRVSTCSSYTDFSSTILVFSGDCGDLVCVNSTEAYPSCEESYNARVTYWISELDTTYYVFVTSGYDVGSFGLSVDEFTPPENQVCENATGPISPDDDPISGSTVGAIAERRIDCSPYYFSSGVWYSVMGTGNDLMASTCAPGNNYDSYTTVYTGECDGLSCIDGNYNGCRSIWSSEEGTLYYIRVSSYGNSDFELDIEELTPTVNDDCGNAITISSGDVTEGSIYTAMADTVPLCNYVRGSVGVWYEIMGTGNAFSLSMCSPKTTFYSQISVYVGACGELDCVDDFYIDYSKECENYYSSSSSVSWLSEEGAIYKVLVSSQYGDTGEFELTVNEFEVGMNDVCENATEISVSSDEAILGTTIGATSGDDDACLRSSFSAGVWYVINTEVGQALRVSTCLDETSVETSISLLSGSCGTLECIESRYSYESHGGKCGYNGATIDWEATDSTYYIVVYGGQEGQRPGNFGLTVEELVRPSNDECAGALELVVDGVSVKGSTSQASSFGAESELYYCGVPMGAPGVWYEIEGTGSGISVSTCSNETNFETAISVYEGSCDGLQCIGGNSYSECNESKYSTSRVLWPSSIDTTYYVLVHGAGHYGHSSVFGEFEMTATSYEPPVNDLCSGAIEVVPDGSGLSGSTLEASTKFNTSSCEVYSDAPGIWYNVVGTGQGMEASTCSSSTRFDTILSVFSGNCGELTCVVGSTWDSRCQFRGNTASWISEVDTTYYILVIGSYASAAGEFELSVTQFEPVANDECDGALEIDIEDGVISGSLSGATRDTFEALEWGPDRESEWEPEREWESQLQCVIGANGPGVWYTLRGTGSAFQASTCSSSYSSARTALMVFSGGCDDIVCVTGNGWDSTCDYGGSKASWVSEAGTQYYILVQGFNPGDSGSFDLSLSTFDPPANDECSDAIDITIDGDEVVGSQANATADTVEAPYCGVSIEAPGVWYKLSGTGSGLRASTCSNFTTYDTALSVYVGGCDSLQCVSGNADDYSSECRYNRYRRDSSTVSWFGEDGSTYYILVHADYSGSGSFGLTVSSFTTAENDHCGGAIEVNPGSVTSGSTLNATVDRSFSSECFNHYDKQHAGSGVWYRVTGRGLTMTASTCSLTSIGRFQANLEVYTGSCSNLTCPIDDGEFVYNNDCQFGGYIRSWDSEVDVEYYILVYGSFSPTRGSFELSLTTGEPPENDSCLVAIPLLGSAMAESVTVTGSTLEASSSRVEGCNETSDSGDVWYSIEGSDMMMTASTCGESTSFDTVVTVYSGSCGELVCVIMNDDSCGRQSSVSWVADSGVQYFVRVQGYLLASGQFELSVSQEPMVTIENDECMGAIAITSSLEGSSVSGSTSQASEDFFGIAHCGAFFDAPGVWYRVEGEGNPVEASTCSDETNYHTALSVFSGDCEDLECVSGAEDDPACSSSSYSSSVRWFAAAGKSYWILVHGHGELSAGNFVMTVRDIESPENDICGSAATITVDGDSVSGSTVSATFENTYWSDCEIFVNSPGVWYRVEGTGSGLEASTCSDDTDFATSLAVFTGGCRNLKCVDVFDEESCRSSSTVQWTSVAGERYYILVFGKDSEDVGTFSLSVTGFAAVANDDCSSAIDIETGSETVGSTSAATRDPGIRRCGDASQVTSRGVWYSTVGDGDTYVASTCDGSSFDTQISVFSGDCDDGLDCIEGNDQSCGDQSVVTWETTDEEVYYILVHGWKKDHGDFTLILGKSETT